MTPEQVMAWSMWHDEHPEMHDECRAKQGGCEWSNEMDLPCLLDRTRDGSRP